MVAATGCSKLDLRENDRDMCGETGRRGGVAEAAGDPGLPGDGPRSKVSLLGEAVLSSNSKAN